MKQKNNKVQMPFIIALYHALPLFYRCLDMQEYASIAGKQA
ncbi:MAG: hypothetical protein R3E36_07660 [Nitrosomonas sp.]|jgi:hypothetical protein